MNPVQYRNSTDYISGDSTWVNGVTAAVAGAETNLLEDEVYARYVRFFYDVTSGGATATINVTYTLKS